MIQQCIINNLNNMKYPQQNQHLMIFILGGKPEYFIEAVNVWCKGNNSCIIWERQLCFMKNQMWYRGWETTNKHTCGSVLWRNFEDGLKTLSVPNWNIKMCDALHARCGYTRNLVPYFSSIHSCSHVTVIEHTSIKFYSSNRLIYSTRRKVSAENIFLKRNFSVQPQI